jgi:hypothetical protein
MMYYETTASITGMSKKQQQVAKEEVKVLLIMSMVHERRLA